MSGVRVTGRTAATLALATAAGVGAASAAVGLSATAAWLIARAAQHPPVLYLMVAIVGVRAFGLGRGVMRYLERLVSHDAALRHLADLRVTVYRRLARLAPAGLRDLRTGDLASRVGTDVDTLADRWLRLLLPYAIAGLVGAATVALVAAILPAAGLTLAASLLAAALAAPAVAALVARRAEARVTPARGDLAVATTDVLHGAADLVAYGFTATHLTPPTQPRSADRPAESTAAETSPLSTGVDQPPAAGTPALSTGVDQFTAADQRLTAAERRAATGTGLAAAVAALAAGVAVWAALALGAPAVASGRLDPVLLAVVVLTPLAIHELYAALGPAAAQAPRIRAAATRVDDLLHRPDPVREPSTPADPPTGPADLCIAGLHARWQPDGPDVLRGIDLDVPAGTRLAIRGPSGAGKSTLAAVLLRFLDPSAGDVTLGGVDLTTLAGDTVRRLVGICAQDAHVFDTTIAENVRLARPDATDTDVADALDRAHLHDWVAAQPEGANTFVGEHGARLSGGQRQRLALARALLADVAVLILDEPTEHLDEPTAEALTAELLTAAAGRTVLLITHRPVDPALVDATLTLTAGQLHA